MLSRKPALICALLFVVLGSSLPSLAQVGLQTGSAVFSLPMFNWQDNSSRLNTAVALSYSSGNGLKVGDVATDVGEGWTLVAGGVITRLQVGEPDDQQAYAGSGTDLDISQYPAGYLYGSVPAANGCPTALTRYPIYGGMNQVYAKNNLANQDKQLDYFSFEFNGKVGEFVLGAGGVGLSLGDTKMKITYQTNTTMTSQGIRTTIASFIIYDVDGLTYKFTVPELTKLLHADFCDANLTKPMTQPSFSGGNVYHQAAFDNAAITNPYVINDWYLSEIDDPLAGKKIVFNYINHNINSTAGADISYNQTGNYTIISHKRSETTTPALSSIVFQDGHQVTFTYGSPRVDLNGDFALAKVDITYTPPGGTTRYLSEYQLNTTYFIRNRYGTPVTPEQQAAARLCLRSVKKIGVDLKEDQPPYIFDYYLTSGTGNADDFIPPPFFYAKDIWGFYNGSNSVPYDNNPNDVIPMNTTLSQLNNDQLEGLCFLNNTVPGQVYINPKIGYAQNGLLRQIIYPTGGTLSYTYAQDSGVLNAATGVVTPVGGVHVLQTSSTDGGYSNGCANPLVTSYGYNTSGAGTAPSLWGLEMPVNSLTLGNHYNSEDLKYHWTLSCAPFGCCYWKYQYPGILSQLEAVSLTSLQQFMNTIGPYLGILTCVSDVLDVLNLVFVDTGFLSWCAVVVDVIGGLVTLGITCFSGDNSTDKSYTIFYNADLNGANPLPAQFKRVEVVENPGTIGKTVQVFTSSDDYALWVPAGANTDFSAKQRYAPWAYGLPKSMTMYDIHGNMIKETVNDYGFGNQACNTPPASPAVAKAASSSTTTATKTSNSIIPLSTSPSCPLIIQTNLGLTSTKCTVNYQYSQNDNDWDNSVGNTYTIAAAPGLVPDTFDLYTGRLQLNDSYTRTYKTSDPTQYVQTMTTFTYNSYYNYEVNEQKTTQSDGTTQNKYINYTSDYPTTQNAGILGLMSANMVSVPVREYATVFNPSTGESALGEKVSEYAPAPNGDILLAHTMEQRFATPPSSSSVTPYSPDNTSNPSIYHYTQLLTWNANEDEIGLQDEGGRVRTNIYDYNDKYVVATVFDANPVLDKPAYTSFETSGLGGWQLTGSPVYSTSAITGAQSLTLSSGMDLSASLNTAKPYTVSFWATAAMSVSGGLVKSGPTINGFTYYEYAIGQGADVVNITGSGNIDELRLYPQMAKMKTTTFDPLIGKTSECDENNRIRYYQYDNLGRLQWVFDEYHNAEKMYEYNNVSAAKQNGCPGTYTNHLITESFARSNCGANYVGGEVSYSVPAAKYTSALSQQDADNQAEIDLLTNGPALANSSGACIPIYYNVAESETVTTESCAEGYTPGTVTYTVPANTYSSTVSQAAANQLALNDVAANAQAYADAPANQVCTLSNSPDWNYTSGNGAGCVNENGTPHAYYWAIDLNPNSPTYNTGQWMDAGPQAASCPGPMAVYALISYTGVYYVSNEAYGNVVVSFFSDAAHTKPFSVTNVTVNYGQQYQCDSGPSETLTMQPITITGTSGVLLTGAPLYGSLTGPNGGANCTIIYVLQPGTGYTY